MLKDIKTKLYDNKFGCSLLSLAALVGMAVSVSAQNKAIPQTDEALVNYNPMIFGQFVEHFHTQVYGGIYDPQSRFADEDGFRTDVIEAMKQIKVPIVRWPGGCYVSSYHWLDGVGENRTPSFDGQLAF